MFIQIEQVGETYLIIRNNKEVLYISNSFSKIQKIMNSYYNKLIKGKNIK